MQLPTDREPRGRLPLPTSATAPAAPVFQFGRTRNARDAEMPAEERPLVLNVDPVQRVNLFGRRLDDVRAGPARNNSRIS